MLSWCSAFLKQDLDGGIVKYKPPFAQIAKPNNEADGWWKYHSTCRSWVASHIIWYGMGSCSLRFRRNPPTVRTAATITTAVTARGTWELAAGAELWDSSFARMSEPSSVHERETEAYVCFPEPVNLKGNKAKRTGIKMLQSRSDWKPNCFIAHCFTNDLVAMPNK